MVSGSRSRAREAPDELPRLAPSAHSVPPRRVCARGALSGRSAAHTRGGPLPAPTASRRAHVVLRAVGAQPEGLPACGPRPLGDHPGRCSAGRQLQAAEEGSQRGSRISRRGRRQIRRAPLGLGVRSPARGRGRPRGSRAEGGRRHWASSGRSDAPPATDGPPPATRHPPPAARHPRPSSRLPTCRRPRR